VGKSPKLSHVLGCLCEICLTDAIVNDETSSSSSSIAPSKSISSHLKSMLKGRGKGKGGFNGLKPIRVKLWSLPYSVSSSAGTGLSAVTTINLSSGQFAEVGDFMLVYDEMRMLGIKVHYFPYVAIVASASPFVSTWVGNVQFDPTASPPGTPAAALQESYNSGLRFLTPGVNGTSAQSSSFHLPYLTVSARVPKLAPLTGADCPGSAWISLDTATAPTMAVIGNAATALGTAGVTLCNFYVELEVEFRLRT